MPSWPYIRFFFVYLTQFRIKAATIQQFYESKQCVYRIEKWNKTITENGIGVISTPNESQFGMCVSECCLWLKLLSDHKRCFWNDTNETVSTQFDASTKSDVCVAFLSFAEEIVSNAFPIRIPSFSIKIPLPFLVFLLTCFSNKSLFADRQVTRYFVKLKNELSTSSVKWSRDDLCNINDITRNPRFYGTKEREKCG